MASTATRMIALAALNRHIAMARISCAMDDRLVALFSFESTRNGVPGTVAVAAEKHYHLVPPDQVSAEELRSYARNPLDGN